MKLNFAVDVVDPPQVETSRQKQQRGCFNSIFDALMMKIRRKKGVDPTPTPHLHPHPPNFNLPTD